MKLISILIAGVLMAGCAGMQTGATADTNPGARFAFVEVVGTPHWFETEYSRASQCNRVLATLPPDYKAVAVTCTPERSTRTSAASISFTTSGDGNLTVRYASTELCAAMRKILASAPAGAPTSPGEFGELHSYSFNPLGALNDVSNGVTAAPKGFATNVTPCK